MAWHKTIKYNQLFKIKNILRLIFILGIVIIMNKAFNYPEKYEPGKDYIFNEAIYGGGTFAYNTPAGEAQPYRTMEEAEDGATSIDISSFYASQQYYHSHNYTLERNKIDPNTFYLTFQPGITYLIKKGNEYIKVNLQQGLDNWEYYRIQRSLSDKFTLAEHIKVTNKGDNYSIYNSDGSLREDRGSSVDNKNKTIIYGRVCYKEDGDSYDRCPWNEESLPDPNTRYGLSALDRWRVMNADPLRYHGDEQSSPLKTGK